MAAREMTPLELAGELPRRQAAWLVESTCALMRGYVGAARCWQQIAAAGMELQAQLLGSCWQAAGSDEVLEGVAALEVLGRR